MQRLLRILALLIAGALVLSACDDPDSNQSDSSGPDTTAVDTASEDDPLCFLALGALEAHELKQYTDVQPDATTPDVDNVCVLEPDGTAAYYTEEDNFANYWLYAMMFRRLSAADLMSYGLIFGDYEDLAFFWAMNQVIGFDDEVNDRRPYRLYHPTTAGFARTPNDSAYLSNVRTVNQLRFGNGKPVKFADAITKPAPGYRLTPVPEYDKEKVGTVSGSGAGFVHRHAKDQKASDLLRGSKPANLAPGQRVVPPTAASASTGSSKPSGTPSKPSTSSGSGATSAPKPAPAPKAAPKPPAPKAPAPAPKPPAPPKPR
jgi:hypothetical protein